MRRFQELESLQNISTSVGKDEGGRGREEGYFKEMGQGEGELRGIRGFYGRRQYQGERLWKGYY